MKRLVIAVVTAFGSICLAGAVAACSSHGTAAGTHFSSWVASNAGGSTAIGVQGSVQATGDQTNDGTNSGGWSNTHYWIDIVMPDGTPVTVKAHAGNNWGNAGTGGQLELWLFTEAQKELRSWFSDYEPLDTAGDDYVG